MARARLQVEGEASAPSPPTKRQRASPRVQVHPWLPKPGTACSRTADVRWFRSGWLLLAASSSSRAVPTADFVRPCSRVERQLPGAIPYSRSRPVAVLQQCRQCCIPIQQFDARSEAPIHGVRALLGRRLEFAFAEEGHVLFLRAVAVVPHDTWKHASMTIRAPWCCRRGSARTRPRSDWLRRRRRCVASADGRRPPAK